MNQHDELLKEAHGLSDEQVAAAQRWWDRLSDRDKSDASMAILFAVYAQHVLRGEQ